MNKIKKESFNHKHQKGQSLVELALTITILLTLLAGAFDLGSAFLDYLAMRDAAQEGVVYGSIDPADTSGIITRVQFSSSTPVKFADFVESCDSDSPNGICISYSGEKCSGDGNTVSVTVRYQHDLIMPFIGAIIGSQTIPLSATVTNVILTTACP